MSAPISGSDAGGTYFLGQDSQTSAPISGRLDWARALRLGDATSVAKQVQVQYGALLLVACLGVQPICSLQASRSPNFALRLSVASMTVSPILCHFDWPATRFPGPGSISSGGLSRIYTSVVQIWTSGLGACWG